MADTGKILVLLPVMVVLTAGCVTKRVDDNEYGPPRFEDMGDTRDRRSEADQDHASPRPDTAAGPRLVSPAETADQPALGESPEQPLVVRPVSGEVPHWPLVR
jgi:hypothetical protein